MQLIMEDAANYEKCINWQKILMETSAINLKRFAQSARSGSEKAWLWDLCSQWGGSLVSFLIYCQPCGAPWERSGPILISKSGLVHQRCPTRSQPENKVTFWNCVGNHCLSIFIYLFWVCFGASFFVEFQCPWIWDVFWHPFLIFVCTYPHLWF